MTTNDSNSCHVTTATSGSRVLRLWASPRAQILATDCHVNAHAAFSTQKSLGFAQTGFAVSNRLVYKIDALLHVFPARPIDGRESIENLAIT
jgi:hypothetical protein